MTTEKTFAFNLGEIVQVPCETGPRNGNVIARGDRSDGSPDQFQVRHFNAHGDEVDVWYQQDQLKST